MEERSGRSGGVLAGARVGLLEGRMGSELANLIRRQGGEPRLAPALRETPVDAAAPVGELVDALARGDVQMVIFLTGVGAAALFREAERIGRHGELVRLLQDTVNISRGQKPWQPLKQAGVPVTVTVPSPYTTAEVLETLEGLDPAGKGVALLHYGERSRPLAEALEEWGARVLELCLYEWQLPEDTRPLEELVEEVIGGELDAVAFTSQVQVRHLLQVAARRGRGQALVEALNSRTVVTAVGPTSAAALEAVGVTPRVVPTNPKMGPMVLALAQWLEARRAGSGARAEA